MKYLGNGVFGNKKVDTLPLVDSEWRYSYIRNTFIDKFDLCRIGQTDSLRDSERLSP